MPEQVAPAQQDAIKAREDKERASAVSRRPTPTTSCRRRAVRPSASVEDAQAYRSRVIADAEGEAARFLALAAEYQRAPGVTRERLYLETMEEVLGTSTKVLVDIEGTAAT